MIVDYQKQGKMVPASAGDKVTMHCTFSLSTSQWLSIPGLIFIQTSIMTLPVNTTNLLPLMARLSPQSQPVSL